MIKRFIWLLMSLPMLCMAQSSKTIVSSITQQQGLPHNSVRDILFTEQGDVWFATLNGLAHYDGYRFEIYRHSPDEDNSPPGNNIYGLLQDKKRRIWLANTENLGYYSVKSGRFSTLSASEAGCERGVRDLVMDSKGDIWGTNVQGDLIHYDMLSEKAKCFTVRSLFGADKHKVIINHAFYHAELNGIWLATERGLLFFDILQQKMQATDSQNPLNDVPSTSVFVDDRQRLWVGTSTLGIFRFDVESGEVEHLSMDKYPELHGVYVNHLSMDKQGVLWITSAAQGVYQFFDDKVKAFAAKDLRHHQTFPQQYFQAKHDWHGNVWLAATTGVFIVPATAAHVSGIGLESISGDGKQRNVTMISVNSQKQLTVATSDGLFRLTPSKSGLTSIRLDDRLPGGSNFNAVYQDDSGQFYACNAGAMFRFSAKDKTIDRKTAIEQIKRCSDFAQSDENILWITTHYDGLIRFDKSNNTATLLSAQPHLPIGQFSQSLMAVTLDDNHLWLGSFDAGVAHMNLNTQHFQAFNGQRNQADRMPGNLATDINLDAQGYLWFSSFSGLSRYDRQKDEFAHFHVKEGLTSEQLNAIKIDREGDLWVSSQFGLTMVDPDNFKMQRYFQYHGLMDNEFNFGAMTQDKDGLIYIGGINGVTIVDPIRLKRENPDFKNFIARVKVGNQTINHLGGEHVLFDEAPNRVTIDFGTTAYTSSHRNQFRYRLNGLETQWQMAENRASIDYSNLSHGDYVFEVQGKTPAGKWLSPSARLKMRIATPWYLSIWAYAFYLLILLGLITSVSQLAAASSKRKAKRLQVKIDEQTASLSEKNLRIGDLLAQQRRLFVQLSHEIRTPLTLICAPWQRLKPEHREQYQNLWQTARFNQERLVHMLDQLLDIAQSGGNAQSNRQPLAVADAVNWVCTAVQPLFEDKQQQFHPTLNYQGHISIHKDSLEKVLLNLLMNAHKYTPEQGVISLRVWYHNGKVCFAVKDNGIGIERSRQTAVFEYFERAPQAEQLPGSGVGLALVKQLVQANDGSIKLESEPGKGSCFTVSFPAFEGEVKETYEPPRDSLLAMEPAAELPIEIDADLHSVISKETDGIDKPLLLIVEDNLQLRGYLKQVFQGQYQIIVADNGEQGLSLAKAQVPDIIVSDVMMPKMDGFELLSAVKSEEITNHIPVVLLTARSDQQSRLTGLGYLADDYIAKPFDEQELRLKLNNLLHLRQMWHGYFQRQTGICAEVLEDEVNEGAIDEVAQEVAGDLPQTLRSDNETSEIEPAAVEQPVECSAIGLVLNPVQQAFIDKLKGVFEENYRNSEYSIDDAADAMALGKRQLQRKIKALCGVSPLNILKDIRLEHARENIVNGEQITQVCYSCGFNGYQQFSRAFKDKYGDSPKVFREKLR